MPNQKCPIRVAVDGRSINTDYLRGAGRYLQELLGNIPETEVRWSVYGDRPDLPLQSPLAKELSTTVFELPGYRFRSWEQFALPTRVWRAGTDVLLCPTTTLPWWQPVPTVVTLHDVIPWLENDNSWEPKWYRNLMAVAYRKCAAIITPSECAARDIRGLWPEISSKIHVIPHGISPIYTQISTTDSPRLSLTAPLKPPYLLYLGGIMPRKRFSWALEMLQGMQTHDVMLAVCGFGASLHSEMLERVPDQLRKQVVFLPFVSENEMPKLYAHAAAVIYPTLYEGFGFPAVEAQAVGVPILMSAVGSLAELQGPGAVVLPPDDLSAWVDATKMCVAHWRTGNRTNDKARHWARRFTWENSAQRHLDVFRSVIRIDKRQKSLF